MSKKISPKTNLIIKTILQQQKQKDIEETGRLSRKSTEKSKSRAQQKKDIEERIEIISKKKTLPSKSMDFMEILKIGLDQNDNTYVKKALDRGLSRLIPDLTTFAYITADLALDNVFFGKLLKDINTRIQTKEYSDMKDYIDLIELKNEVENKLGYKPKQKTNRSRSKSMI
jgi:hypothetical protein